MMLADAGYPASDFVLAPYREASATDAHKHLVWREHKHWGGGRHRQHKHLFNAAVKAGRDSVERGFGDLKGLFPRVSSVRAGRADNAYRILVAACIIILYNLHRHTFSPPPPADRPPPPLPSATSRNAVVLAWQGSHGLEVVPAKIRAAEDVVGLIINKTDNQ